MSRRRVVVGAGEGRGWWGCGNEHLTQFLTPSCMTARCGLFVSSSSSLSSLTHHCIVQKFCFGLCWYTYWCWPVERGSHFVPDSGTTVQLTSDELTRHSSFRQPTACRMMCRLLTDGSVRLGSGHATNRIRTKRAEWMDGSTDGLICSAVNEWRVQDSVGLPTQASRDGQTEWLTDGRTGKHGCC